MTVRCLAALFILFLYCPAFSQLALPDSTTGTPVVTATQVFMQALRNEKEIYNGPEHVDYSATIEGLAYFNTKEWQTGSVQYYGLIYHDEPMQLDLVKDRLVVRRPDGFAVELRSDKVDWFSLAGHVFVYADEENISGLSSGFYDQLAAGAITVLVKHRKHYEDRAEQTRAMRRFVDETSYYAVQNNQAHTIRNMHSLLELMGGRSNEVQQQLRRAGLKFREDREAALAAAARFYNQTQP